jgi:hypothetical protein
MTEERNTEPIRIYFSTKAALAEIQHAAYVKTGSRPSHADIIEAMRTSKGKGFDFAHDSPGGRVNASVMKLRESVGELLFREDALSDAVVKFLGELHGMTRRELEQAAIPAEHGKRRR